MSDTDTLNLWHEHRRFGELWRNPAGAIGFRYAPEWIGDGFAVSRTLPLVARNFAPEDGTAQHWFANLLPEGSVREHIVRDIKLPNTDFDLLRAIGGECAGALSILSLDQQPSGQRQYRPLTEKDLADLAARRGQIYAAWPRTSARGYRSPAHRTSARYWYATIRFFCLREKRLLAIS